MTSRKSGKRDDGEVKGTVFGRYRAALALWAAFLGTFLVLLSLYVKFSEPFLLSVFEVMQVHRAQIEGRGVQKAIIDYEDYIRVDPESIYVRGLLVSSYLEAKSFDKAEENAALALDLAAKDEQPLSWLIASRVPLARGNIEAALPYIEDVLEASADSGEGHYQRAQVYLAQGESEEAEKEFALVQALGPRDSTREYLEEWNARLGKVEAYEREIEAGVGSAKRLYELGAEFQRLGRLDEARDLYSKAKDDEKFSPNSNGVLELPAFDF